MAQRDAYVWIRHKYPCHRRTWQKCTRNVHVCQQWRFDFWYLEAFQTQDVRFDDLRAADIFGTVPQPACLLGHRGSENPAPGTNLTTLVDQYKFPFIQLHSTGYDIFTSMKFGGFRRLQAPQTSIINSIFKFSLFTQASNSYRALVFPFTSCIYSWWLWNQCCKNSPGWAAATLLDISLSIGDFVYADLFQPLDVPLIQSMLLWCLRVYAKAILANDVI